MAISCDILTAGLSSYACSSNAAGTNNIWLTNIDNLSALTIASASTTPTVTALSLTGSTKFYAMNPYQFTAEFQITNQRSEFGNNTYTPVVRFRCNQVTTAVMQTAYKMTRGKLAAIVKLNSGIYILAGVDDTTTPTNSLGLVSSKADLLSGIKSSDFMGYDFELAGGAGTYPIEVASSIIASITSN